MSILWPLVLLLALGACDSEEARSSASMRMKVMWAEEPVGLETKNGAKAALPNARRSPADQWPDTVFLGGEKGRLSCAFLKQVPFIVDWDATIGDDGAVWIDGQRAKGEVYGDWEPNPNRVLFSLEAAGVIEETLVTIRVSDNGALTDEEGTEGICHPIAE